MFCSRCGTEVQDGAKFCPSCGLDLSSTTPVQAIKQEAESEADLVRDALKDEYEVISELGRGGMAIVFKAREKALDREVAVKVLPFSLAFDQEFVERFQREARTSAKLEHPHIIPIYRVGKSGRIIYFVMKFLRGKSLSDIVEGQGMMEPAKIRKLLIQTAGALGYAHKNGIVHRDIKPDNIMFDESDNAIVTDFGIAKAASGTRLTGTGMSIGTPHYMSPEQARAQPLDGRSDVYSLGVVAYQCLTGTVPFEGEDSFAIGYKHIMEPVPVPELRTAEQRELFAVVQKMMAKQQQDRFQSAEALVAALEGRAPVPVMTTPTAAVSADAPTTVMPATPGGTRPGFATSTPTTPMPRTQPPRPAAPKKKRSGVLVGAFMVLLAGGGGAGWYFTMGPGASPSAGDPGEQPIGGLPIAVANTTAVADSADTTTTAGDSTPAAPPVELPNHGWIALSNIPSRGATITIDGDATSDAVTQVPPGSRQIRAVRAGYQTIQTTVAVERGDTATFRFEWRQVQAARPDPPPRRPAETCTEPGPTYNANGGCFDTRPSLVGVAPYIDRPAGLTERPSPFVAWLLIGTDGTVKRIVRSRDSDQPSFTIAASRWAQQQEYRPATKDGRPVEAWTQLQFISR